MTRRTNDIKAPDGYLLGGLRNVRADGTILFQRGFWRAPIEWVGEQVWVHADESASDGIHAAPPGEHIYSAQLRHAAEWCPRTERPDAKSGHRNAAHKAWHARNASAMSAFGQDAEERLEAQPASATAKPGRPKETAQNPSVQP